MNYDMTKPCKECPFLNKHKKGYSLQQHQAFSSGEFPCHKTADTDGEGNFVATDDSSHCAGALIFLEKRKQSTQMMRICERLGMYDATKLDMTADVR